MALLVVQLVWLAVLTPAGVDIRSLDNTPVVRAPTEITGEIGAAEKGGYEHFMLKEIFEQSHTIYDCLRGRLDALGGTIKMSGVEKYIDEGNLVW